VFVLNILKGFNGIENIYFLFWTVFPPSLKGHLITSSLPMFEEDGKKIRFEWVSYSNNMVISEQFVHPTSIPW